MKVVLVDSTSSADILGMFANVYSEHSLIYAEMVVI